MHPYLNIAIKAARTAGKIIVDATLRPNIVEVRKKSEEILDLVTNIDKAAEEAILNTILRAYPTHNIKTEESGEQFNNSEFTWIIDPLDGTLNFVYGLPFFAVSIAVMQGSNIEHGVVYNPIADELFVASKGSGAQLNNKKIRCSSNYKLTEALLAIDTDLLCQWDIYNNNKKKSLLRGETGIINRDMGAAALQLAFVASGRLDGYCAVDLKPWDIAAGALLVKESGGYITDFNGKAEFFNNGNIVVGNPKIYNQLIELVSIN